MTNPILTKWKKQWSKGLKLSFSFIQKRLGSLCKFGMSEASPKVIDLCTITIF